MVNVDDLELAERENSNLRRHLLWLAWTDGVTSAARAELGRRIASPIDDGGVVEDLAEEEAERRARMSRAIDRLCDLVREGVDLDDVPNSWWGKLDEAANQLLGFTASDDKIQPRTFHEIRELAR